MKNRLASIVIVLPLSSPKAKAYDYLSSASAENDDPAYDAVSGEWWEYDGESGELTNMEMGRGYWIHTDKEQDWSLSYL